MRMRTFRSCVAAWVVCSVCLGCKPDNDSCDLASPDCGDTICYADGHGGGVCTDACDLGASACEGDAVCLATTGGAGVCAEACDVAAPDCGDGRVCFPAGGGLSACAEACDPAASSCGEGRACLALSTGGVCVPTCDSVESDACGDALTCDAIAGGGFGCFVPVVLVGTITDAATGAGISGALVFAADATGAVVTNAAVTDATGAYALTVPVLRDAAGNPMPGTFTLRASASGYLGFPTATRPALPIATASAALDTTAQRYALTNALTNVALIALPAEAQGLARISGALGGDAPAGTLVVAECTSAPCPFGYADRDGNFTIFNVPDGSYSVRSYKVGQQLAPADVTIVGAASVEGLSLAPSAAPLVTVNGMLNPVSGAELLSTSVVLMPASTFEVVPFTTSSAVLLDNLIVIGEVAPGLRAPPPGTPPNVMTTYSIANVPEGDYVVIAGFENDGVIRDPDSNQAGTDIVTIHIPGDLAPSSTTLMVSQSFKTIPALTTVSPGQTMPEAITLGTTPTFSWVDSAQEDTYEVVVINALGEQVWTSPVAKNSASIVYAGPALSLGMFYQWRLISVSVQDIPIGATEDLRGVFFVTSP